LFGLGDLAFFWMLPNLWSSTWWHFDSIWFLQTVINRLNLYKCSNGHDLPEGRSGCWVWRTVGMLATLARRGSYGTMTAISLATIFHSRHLRRNRMSAAATSAWAWLEWECVPSQSQRRCSYSSRIVVPISNERARTVSLAVLWLAMWFSSNAKDDTLAMSGWQRYDIGTAQRTRPMTTPFATGRFWCEVLICRRHGLSCWLVRRSRRMVRRVKKPLYILRNRGQTS
jgi:hypothetical protein